MEQACIHNIEPVYDKTSKILILGSFPSVKSRENQFFYGHPQNRFWKVLSEIYCEPFPQSIIEKKELLIKHSIAVWDVVFSCTINGSSDSSIKNVVPCDVPKILSNSQIGKIYTNGLTAQGLYNKYLYEKLGKKAICLPSTSPANARYSLEKLVLSWSIIKNSK